MSQGPAANQRFKQSSRTSFWISLIVATVFHAAVFAGSPVMALEERAEDEEPVVVVNVPDDIRMPEPPPPVRTPAAPVISVDAPTDATLERFDPSDWKDRPLDPPPPSAGGEPDGPFRTPMEVAPRLLNPAEVQGLLRRHYPPVLRDARIGGTVSVWFHIDAEGRVLETRIQRSSGYDALDEAALEVADRMEFSPAYNRDLKVPVWVALEVKFEVQ